MYTSNPQPVASTSRITTWPLEFEDPDPSSSSSRPIHLNFPSAPASNYNQASTSTLSRSVSHGKKRSNRDGSDSPKRSKRVREATPIDNDDTSNSTSNLDVIDLQEGTSSFHYLNASAPNSIYPTTAAGPSSYSQYQDQDVVRVYSENGDVEEGSESKSVLFSEQNATSRTNEFVEEDGIEAEGDVDEHDEDEEGDDTIIIPSGGKFIPEEFLIENEHQEGDEQGEEYFIEQEENFEPQDNPPNINNNINYKYDNSGDGISTNSRPLTIDLRKVMPPPTDIITKSKSTSSSRYSNSGLAQDTMTQILEGSTSKHSKINNNVLNGNGRKHSFVELDQNCYNNKDNNDELEIIHYNQNYENQAEQENGDDDEESSNESYHSGDSDEFEMTHRPILERTAVKRDIKNFIESVTVLREGIDGYLPFRVVDRLGEGTFSSVYLAHDCLNRTYANQYWSEIPDDQDEDIEEPPEVKVALKKILVTSSPARIENELAILEALRGCRNVSQLISAFREDDQIIIVLPFHRSDDFRHFYRHMDPPHIRSYLQSLFRALKDIHRRGIVHRDVKPANFLYDYETGEGVLVDFGLAERYIPPRRPTCQHAPATLSSLQGSKIKTNETPIVEQAVYDARKKSRLGEGRIGFPHEDKRPTIKTNRAGTRGFRAPEVLLKCPDQTVAIDIWSAGVMLLSILTHKFPVFNSSDDIEALMEIAAIFGRSAMEKCALLHNRTIVSNIPTLDYYPSSLASLVLRLNPHIYTPHMTNPTPEESREHIEAVDQAIDLCQKLLRLDATKRLSAATALRHPFLAPREDEVDEEEGRDELIDPREGKCGHLHDTEDGRHRAYFHPDMRDLAFGQGIPPTRDSLCPEHEHYQDRFQINPLVTRRWVMEATEDDNQEHAEEQEAEDEEEELRRSTEEHQAWLLECEQYHQSELAKHQEQISRSKSVNGYDSTLKERDINSNYQDNTSYNGKRRGRMVGNNDRNGMGRSL